MDPTLISRCGDYCGACAPREKLNCPGCQAARGAMFWGTCQVARCTVARGIAHCGLCADVPCALLQGVFDHPEHGDNGERLANLRAWARGEDGYVLIGTFPRPTPR